MQIWNARVPSFLFVQFKILVYGRRHTHASCNGVTLVWGSLMQARPNKALGKIVTSHQFCHLMKKRASPTLAWLHCAHACVCLLACLLGPTTYIPISLNVNITKIEFMHLLVGDQGRLPECNPVTWSWDDWSWSTHGKLLLVCYKSSMAACPQAVQFRSWRWLRSRQDGKDHA